MNILQKAGSLLLLCAGLTASAAEFVDLGEITAGTPLEYPSGAYAGLMAKFTPDATTEYTVTFTNTGSGIMPYATWDASTKTASDLMIDPQAVGIGREYTFNATANKPVYFYSSFVFDGGQMTVTKSSDIVNTIELVGSVPEKDENYTIANGFDGIELQFNKAIQVASATVTCGSKTETVTPDVQNGQFWNGVALRINDMVKGWYDDGTVKGGETLTVTLTGLKSADGKVTYGSDGVFTMSWVMAPKPLTLVSSVGLDKPFKSYYTQNDPDGLIMLTFSGSIGGCSSVTMGFGNTEAEDPGEYYSEELPTRVLDNVLVIDLKGKLRNPASMVTSGTNYDSVLLKVIKVTDADGQPVYSGGGGTIGTFSYNLKYEEIKDDVMAGFTPETTAEAPVSIDDVDNIEIVITDEASLIYDGVKFSYTVEGEPMDIVVRDFKKETDADDFTTLTVAIPNIVRGKGLVTVTLNGLDCKSGIDHSAELTAVYKSEKAAAGYELTTLTYNDISLLGEGVQVEAFTDGTVIKATFSSADGYDSVYMNLNEKESGDWLYGGNMNKLEDGTWTYTWPTKSEFSAGKEYELTFLLQSGPVYNPVTVGTVKVSWTGKTAGAEYSTLTLTSVSPENGSNIYIEAPIEITLNFSGKVQLVDPSYPLGMGAGTAPLEYKNADGAKEGLSETWTITAGAEALEYLTFFAKDEAGLPLNGGGANGRFSLAYHYKANLPVPVVTPSDEVVTSLKDFTIAAPGNEVIILSYYTSDPILFIKGDREIIQQFTDEDLTPITEDRGGEEKFVGYKFSLKEEVTDPGEYKLVVPEEMFNMGEEYSSQNMRGVTMLYTIEGEAPQPGDKITTVPATDTVLDELSEILITFTECESAGWTDTEMSDVELLKDGETLVAKPVKDYGEAWNALLLKFETPIKDAGSYTLRLPAGSYILNDDPDTEQPELTFNFIVKQAGVSGIMVAADEEVRVFNLQGVLVREGKGAETLNGLNGLYIVNGKKVFLRK